MNEKIYFQWQNKVLRDTIYPVRDMKLRHFLLYYKEIDLWAKYKDKTLADCQKEKAEYQAAQEKAIVDAFNNERELRNYFIKPLSNIVSEDGKDEMAELKNFKTLLGGLYSDFRNYFDNYKNEKDASSRDRKEKIFVAMRMAEWEQRLKEMKQKIAKKQNLLADPKVIDKDKKTEEIKVLEDTVLKGIKDELEKLKLLVSAQNKLEKRKEEFAKRQKELLKQQDDILKVLEPLQKLIKACELDQKKVETWITRLKNPPDLKEVLNYFSKADIYADIRERFDQDEKLPTKKSVIAKTVLARVIDIFRDTLGDATHSFHDELLKNIKNWIGPEKRDPDGILQWIGVKAATVQNAQKKLDDVIRALEADTESMRKAVPEGSTHIPGELTYRLHVLNILRDTSDIGIWTRIVNESDMLEDLQAAINHLHRPDKLGDLIDKEKSKLEERLKKLLGGKNLPECLTKEADLKKKLEPVETDLQVTREIFLSKYVPDRPVNETEKDQKKAEEKLQKEIVQFLAEKYYAELLDFDHDKLLHEVYLRFWKEPQRFPLWLQYMVVHFSGMRYASAHGSWADPKELFLNLRTAEIQKEIEEELRKMDDGVLKASSDERVATYGPLKKAVHSPASLPEYARAAASDEKFIKRFQEYYLAQFNSPRADKQRKAFFDLRIDEESCEIRAMKSENVLEELKAYKAEHNLPPSMWKEIVRLTDLRLTEVDSKDWEALTPEEQKERLSTKDKQMWKYHEIMNEWKAEHLTGWRKEHERSNRLIVTRAVCNEVAEHIQHLRGHEGAAGLAGKPFWYKDAETEYFKAKDKRPAGPRPFFVRAKDRDDFEVGASILWLRFVNDIPNEWRVARDLVTKEGDGLIPSAYRGRNMDSSGWVYSMGEPIQRTRTPVKKKGAAKEPTQKQWLRWMHEATVAIVEETAEGTVVLTFETALPYEDPSVSTIGVFKRYLDDLTDDLGEDAFNPAFVGFMPEGKIPVSALDEMLDWNHILLKEVVSAAELEAYREKYIRHPKPAKTRIEFITEHAPPPPVMALKPLCEFVKWTDSHVTKENNLWKVRIWGDPNLPGLTTESESVKEKAPSNFQAVGLYNEVTGRGAVSNFITIERDDINNLIAMQIEDEYEHKETDWRKQKMNWLCKDKGTIYFTKGGKGWETAPSTRWGTLALGGNIVQVKRFVSMKIKEGGKKKEKEMAELVGFSKSDWSRPLDKLLAEGLVHRCFCAYKSPSPNWPGDTPKGIVYSPFFNLQDWKFGEKGNKKPQALYIPADQLVKPGSKEYEEDVKKGYEGIAERRQCEE